MATRTVKIQIKMRDKSPIVKGKYSLDDLMNVIINETNAEIARIDKVAFERLRKKIVNRWYRSYYPAHYARHRTLYYFANSIIEDNAFFIDYGLSGYHSGGHRVHPAYLYKWVFQLGFHGGAYKGPNHPSPGRPYYRTPFPEYSAWGYPAIQSFSIEEALMTAWDDYVEKIGKPKAKKIFTLVLHKYRKELLIFKQN